MAFARLVLFVWEGWYKYANFDNTVDSGIVLKCNFLRTIPAKVQKLSKPGNLSPPKSLFCKMLS